MSDTTQNRSQRGQLLLRMSDEGSVSPPALQRPTGPTNTVQVGLLAAFPGGKDGKE